MLSKPFDEITADDVTALLADSVPEGITLEYKSVLPEKTESGTKKFLASISSFANAAGGDLVYGVREENGAPTQISALPDLDADQAILRLDSMHRDGIAPRIPGIRIRAVDGFDGGSILILRIPKSWCSPHMVTFKGTSRFYTRTNAGKYQMEVSEIRSAFALSEALPIKIADWRNERLGRIIANEGPISLAASSSLVVHLIPFSSFSRESSLAIHDVLGKRASFQPLGALGWDDRINIDGLLNFRSRGDDGKASSYCQVFRSGRVESVRSGVARQGEHGLFLSGSGCEEEIVDWLRQAMAGMRLLDVPPPFSLCVAIVGAKGANIPWNRHRDPVPIDRDSLMLPDVLLESYDLDVAVQLRHMFDAIWNASGYVGSPSFDDEGQWDPNRSRNR